jgi:hypothetical protein
MRVWKILGLAGLIGGVAVGVAVGARHAQRTRREYVDADITELRDRLRARFAQITPT